MLIVVNLQVTYAQQQTKNNIERQKLWGENHRAHKLSAYHGAETHTIPCLSLLRRWSRLWSPLSLLSCSVSATGLSHVKFRDYQCSRGDSQVVPRLLGGAYRTQLPRKASNQEQTGEYHP